MDALKYTNEELEKQMNLLEIHLKQASSTDEAFCSDCIRKHLLTIEGLAEEGMGFSDNPQKYSEIVNVIKEMKTKDPRKEGVEMAKKIRSIRKSLSNCPECIDELGSEKKVEILENLAKSLNTLNDLNNQRLNSNKDKMVEYMDLALTNAGQFVAEGLNYVAENYPSGEPGKYKKYIQLGGGVGLQVLGLFLRQLPRAVKTLSLVAGSNLLARGVISLVKEGTTATARVRVGGAPVRRVSGPTLRVSSLPTPTRTKRAAIMASPVTQRYEAPEHADLIRVD